MTWKSLKIAGDELNRNIIQYAQQHFNLLLGERQAEEAKVRIGSAKETGEPSEYPVRGRDLLSGLPREVMVSDAEIREAIARPVALIVNAIKSVLEVTPPELMADIHERGIVLSGGGALLRGLDQLIAEATEIPVRITDDPLTCVVRGTGILLEHDQLLDTIALPYADSKNI